MIKTVLISIILINKDLKSRFVEFDVIEEDISQFAKILCMKGTNNN